MAAPQPLTPVTVYMQGHHWNVEQATFPQGDRYRYRCNVCRKPGRWYTDGNLADGDNHLYNVHKIGE